MEMLDRRQPRWNDDIDLIMPGRGANNNNNNNTDNNQGVN